jgi:hypothetical protein
METSSAVVTRAYSSRHPSTIRFRRVQPVDPSEDLTAASILAVLAFIVFTTLAAGLATETFSPDDEAVAWVGAGLVGLASLILAAWATVLYSDTDVPWAGRLGDDLAIAGAGFLFFMAGVPTFVAGVI